MSAPAKVQVNWKAHLEVLPLPTWIMEFTAEQCGPIFANRACREILGLWETPSDGEVLSRYLHPEDRPRCLLAWSNFLRGHHKRFHQLLRWTRPDTGETITLVARAQRLRCGDIQGWLRSAAAEQALSRLEELCDARR